MYFLINSRLLIFQVWKFILFNYKVFILFKYIHTPRHGCSPVNCCIFSEHLFLRTSIKGCYWTLVSYRSTHYKSFIIKKHINRKFILHMSKVSLIFDRNSWLLNFIVTTVPWWQGICKKWGILYFTRYSVLDWINVLLAYFKTFQGTYNSLTALNFPWYTV